MRKTVRLVVIVGSRDNDSGAPRHEHTHHLRPRVLSCGAHPWADDRRVGEARRAFPGYGVSGHPWKAAQSPLRCSAGPCAVCLSGDRGTRTLGCEGLSRLGEASTCFIPGGRRVLTSRHYSERLCGAGPTRRAHGDGRRCAGVFGPEGTVIGSVTRSRCGPLRWKEGACLQRPLVAQPAMRR
jgi:hypothetical protein